MSKRIEVVTVVGVLMLLALSACTAPQRLVTADARAAAVSTAFADVADAMQERDTDRIEKLTCVNPSVIELPASVTRGEGRLAVSVGTIEPFEIHDTTYVDRDPDAEFHVAPLMDPGPDADGGQLVREEAIVRVDDRRACLWTLGNSMLTPPWF